MLEIARLAVRETTLQVSLRESGTQSDGLVEIVDGIAEPVDGG